VRPILKIDLPFVEGVSLKDFSRITVDEFDSYSGFRNFLRKQLLDMDDSLNHVQSEIALAKLSVEIGEGVRSVHSDMRKARRTAVLSATGAAIATTTATLVAVYGPALKEAMAIIGGAGGAWGVINAIASNNT
jgi:hypothetical protein